MSPWNMRPARAWDNPNNDDLGAMSKVLYHDNLACAMHVTLILHQSDTNLTTQCVASMVRNMACIRWNLKI